ncbi:TIR domain-containing protein [Lyngbya aestuarii]|uniref:TIR domain-containing protein n=1 Tax=Lyngbya aestuarii TaxID=118322 RepID=UPI00403DE44A
MSAAESSISSPPNRDDYDIFISYSRRDKEFVSQLCEALTQAKQKIWVDWHDIPPAEDWRQEIYRGIEAANNFVFIISPHSISSKVCIEELEHAIKHGKRLVPIVRQNVGYDNVHPDLGRINWIFFREEDDFDGALDKLISAIKIDLRYVREQTHLLVRARKWEKEGRNKGYLLQGSELKKAEQWLVESESKQPPATALHREYIETSRRVETEREDAEMRLRRLTPQQVKNRQAILNKVRNFWVKGVLENSLHDQVLIELGLEKRADAVVSAWNMELATTDEAQKALPKGTKVIAIFDQLGEGRTLLILGEPGAGKTTTLLELTRDLLNRAEQGLDYRIPIVFNLSSWVGKKQKIADWLVAELNSRYQVPKQIGKDLLAKQELLLLLDGLDEVKAELRDSCVAALNDFHQNYAPEMVVCSRIKDYSVLSNRLNFQSAVYVRSLTPEQVSNYIDSIDADLTGLRALMADNTALQELAKSPLMLNIMVLAYQGVAVEDLPKTEVVEERRKQLFDAYIERMFRRPTRLKVEQRYSEVQTKRWLTWLAQRMVQESQTVFLIEEMQPRYLKNKFRQWQYWVLLFIMNLVISGTISTIVVLQWFQSEHSLSWSSISNRLLLFSLCLGFVLSTESKADSMRLIMYPIVQVFCFLFRKKLPRDFRDNIPILHDIDLSRRFRLKFPSFRTLKDEILQPSLEFAYLLSYCMWRMPLLPLLLSDILMCVLFIELKPEILKLYVITKQKSRFLLQPVFKPLAFLTTFLTTFVAFIFFLIPNSFFALFTETIEESLAPNYRVKEVSKTAFFISMLFCIFSIVAFQMPAAYYRGIPCILGFLAGFTYLSLLKHLSLRLILYHNNYIPWNYARFLDYAAERIFLQKVGGGYIFIHRLLLEHFAQIELEPVRL